MKLEIKNVSLSISGKKIVEDISISVSPGQIIGLLGPNGAGKTTTFNMAVGNLKPNKGDIFMNNKLITNLSLPIRSKLGLGYLPQEASIFRDLTVRDNIDLALQNSGLSKSLIRNRREKIVNEFNLNKFVDNFGYQLSGGERRRCEIARAISVGQRGPKYLLLDEPFAGIDPIAVEEIKELLQEISKNNISILITDHNVRETLSLCKRAVILSEGIIIAEGNEESLKQNAHVKKEYFGEMFS